MILHLSPEAPVVLRFGASAILALHIAGGAAGIVFGATATLAGKGGRLHRVAGTVFFVAMLTMAVIGGAVAPFLPLGRWTNTTAAIFTFYLTATGWMTVQRRPGRTGAFERAAVAAPLGLSAMGLMLAALYAGGPQAPGFYGLWGFCAAAAFAAACDLRVIRAGGVTGSARIGRHLWRMGTAWCVAVSSFFLGQQRFLPEAVRDTVLPALPVIAAAAMTIFWAVRTRLQPRRRTAAA